MFGGRQAPGKRLRVRAATALVSPVTMAASVFFSSGKSTSVEPIASGVAVLGSFDVPQHDSDGRWAVSHDSDLGQVSVAGAHTNGMGPTGNRLKSGLRY